MANSHLERMGLVMSNDVHEELSKKFGKGWQVLGTGGGCYVLEYLLPSQLLNGVDRVWVTGDDVLDIEASVNSFGSRVQVCLMAGGLEAEDKDEYCVAECSRDTGAYWNDDTGEIDNVTASDICRMVAECLEELGVK